MFDAHIASAVGWVERRQLSQGSDPRIGSGLDNSTSTSVLAAPTGSNSSSGFSLLMTLIPTLVYAIVCTIIFIILRRGAKYARVYAPRTLLNSLAPHERITPLPTGLLNWVIPFARLPEALVLNQSSIEGFLFLRYLKVLCVICVVGCIIIWPVLLPLNANGGAGQVQLDILTFGNITVTKWYYGHAIVAILFYGFILYMISRECIYFINLRQAYLTTPLKANHLSATTVLFTCVPQHLLDEKILRGIFGHTVCSIWIPRDTTDLDKLVDERDKTAMRLEKGEIALLRAVNKARNEAIKNGFSDDPKSSRSSGEKVSEDKTSREKAFDDSSSDAKSPRSPTVKPAELQNANELSAEEYRDYLRAKRAFPSPSVSHLSSASTKPLEAPTPELYSNMVYGAFGPVPDVNGSLADQWIDHSARPSHRPLANYLRRVDTIKWTRTKLRELNRDIKKLERQYRFRKGRPIGSVFIGFRSQSDAQNAGQTLCHHRPHHMAPHVVGIRPTDIIWRSLQMQWWERVVRRYAMQAFIAVMVIFWSIPSALIGSISNIQFLTSKVPFLGWIALLPTTILGLITGLLPAVAMSLLMSTVPYILRRVAREAGVATLPEVELFTQNAYFVFQVVQVFLITTLSSAISATLTTILENPSSAESILAHSIPKASNFYVSYFVLQGFAMSASRIVHLGSIFRFHIMKGGSTPRATARQWHRLRRIRWGAVYPVFTNMAVIAISYSCIAPIVLGFAAVGLFVVYLSYRYNLLYVYSSEIDAEGLHYPRALKQLLTGLYLAEICMLGLFAVAQAYIPAVLMVIFIVFTILVHFSLDDALGPLMRSLPLTLTLRSRDELLEKELRDKGDRLAEVDLETAGPAYDDDFDPSIGVAHNPVQLPPPNHLGIHYSEDFDPSAPHGSSAMADANSATNPNYYEVALPPTIPAVGNQYSEDFDPGNPTGAARTFMPKPAEGVSNAMEVVQDTLTTKVEDKLYITTVTSHASRFLSPFTSLISPDPSLTPTTLKKPSTWGFFIIKWLHPEVFSDHHILRLMLNETYSNSSIPETEYPEDIIANAYHPPSVRNPVPVIWLPRDKAKIWEQEVRHTSEVIKAHSEGAEMDEKGRVIVDVPASIPGELPRLLY